MAVPSSGELKLRADIANEVDGSATGDNVSLGTLSNTAGFTEPDEMSEFYGYTACSAPSVTTNSLSGVSATQMTANGNVTNDNGCTVTARGFYFGTNSNYASNSKLNLGSGTGVFNSVRGVSPSTTYYCTAWAENSEGESVGSTVNATSSAPITYTFTNNYVAYREIEGGNWGPWYGSEAKCYGQYSHSQLGWQTTNSCVNGTITNDGYSPPSGLMTSKCNQGQAKSNAYFVHTNSPATVSSRVYCDAKGHGGSWNCCYDLMGMMGGTGSSMGTLTSCSYSYYATYGGTNVLASSPSCTGGTSNGCPNQNPNCQSWSEFGGSWTLS